MNRNPTTSKNSPKKCQSAVTEQRVTRSMVEPNQKHEKISRNHNAPKNSIEPFRKKRSQVSAETVDCSEKPDINGEPLNKKSKVESGGKNETFPEEKLKDSSKGDLLDGVIIKKEVLDEQFLGCLDTTIKKEIDFDDGELNASFRVVGSLQFDMENKESGQSLTGTQNGDNSIVASEVEPSSHSHEEEKHLNSDDSFNSSRPDVQHVAKSNSCESNSTDGNSSAQGLEVKSCEVTTNLENASSPESKNVQHKKNYVIDSENHILGNHIQNKAEFTSKCATETSNSICDLDGDQNFCASTESSNKENSQQLESTTFKMKLKDCNEEKDSVDSNKDGNVSSEGGET